MYIVPKSILQSHIDKMVRQVQASLMALHGPSIFDLKDKIKNMNFDYQEREDAHHWQTLLPFIEETKAFIAKYIDVEDLLKPIQNREYKALNKRVPFTIYMLDAFERGERFIVAKLAYDGGAA